METQEISRAVSSPTNSKRTTLDPAIARCWPGHCSPGPRWKYLLSLCSLCDPKPLTPRLWLSDEVRSLERNQPAALGVKKVASGLQLLGTELSQISKAPRHQQSISNRSCMATSSLQRQQGTHARKHTFKILKLRLAHPRLRPKLAHLINLSTVSWLEVQLSNRHAQQKTLRPCSAFQAHDLLQSDDFGQMASPS